MSFLNSLFDASNSVQDLNLFIQDNSIELYDFFITQKSSSIIVHRKEIENYILPKYSIYKQLDYSNINNQSFVFYLLDVSERFGLATEFEQLHNLSEEKNIILNSRIKASAKFLVGINKFEDYENRIHDILSDLSISFLKEEDNEYKTIASLIRFYTEVFYNFSHNKKKVIEFREKLINELQKDETRFLLTPDIEEVLSYSLEDIEQLYKAVQTKLDEILEKASQHLAFNIEPHLIEDGTYYSDLLAGLTTSFEQITKLCMNLYSVVASNEIFWSLQRGVKVLTEQNQLLAYLNSYGKMHFAKMMSALRSVEESNFEDKLEIFDWGCGQGLATVCFLEHLTEQNINNSIIRITLIEPSEIALKRASLHVRKFSQDSQITTINKDLDSLELNDLKNNNDRTKVHLFSNILDIDMFSMNDLIDKIKVNFTGKNVFICASPYVSNFKTQRLDNFTQAFKNNDNYQIISEISEKKGEWSGTDWSRVIRVFSCLINP